MMFKEAGGYHKLQVVLFGSIYLTSHRLILGTPYQEEDSYEANNAVEGNIPFIRIMLLKTPRFNVKTESFYIHACE